jgi:hypothetical protein
MNRRIEFGLSGHTNKAEFQTFAEINRLAYHAGDTKLRGEVSVKFILTHPKSLKSAGWRGVAREPIKPRERFKRCSIGNYYGALWDSNRERTALNVIHMINTLAHEHWHVHEFQLRTPKSSRATVHGSRVERACNRNVMVTLARILCQPRYRRRFDRLVDYAQRNLGPVKPGGRVKRAG